MIVSELLPHVPGHMHLHTEVVVNGERAESCPKAHREVRASVRLEKSPVKPKSSISDLSERNRNAHVRYRTGISAGSLTRVSLSGLGESTWEKLRCPAPRAGCGIPGF